MKEIKAWAIIDKNGDLIERDGSGVEYCGPLLWMRRKDAKQDIVEEGERVVRVTVMVEE